MIWSLISQGVSAGHIPGLCSVIGVSGKTQSMEQEDPLKSGLAWIARQDRNWDTDYFDSIDSQRER